MIKSKLYINKLTHNIRQKIALNNTMFCFILFSLIIFLKNILFHYFIFNEFNLDLLASPVECISFWFHKFFPAIVLGSFFFITKRIWWSVIILVLIDIWLISNLLYFGANELLIDAKAISLISNLSGFWDSLILYFKFKYILIILLTIVYLCIIKQFTYSRILNKRYAIICWIFTILYIPTSQFQFWLERLDSLRLTNNEEGIKKTIKDLQPLLEPLYIIRTDARGAFYDGTNKGQQWEKSFIYRNSIIQYFPCMLYYNLMYSFYESQKEPIKLTDTDKKEIEQKLRLENYEQKIIPESNLVIILIESFESWVISKNDIDGKVIMPNLQNWMSKYPILQCNHIKSEVKHGVSGDGQLIINTGLLPISNGVACILFGDNIFPNLAHFYNGSTTINPATGAWNQSVVNKSYGIKELQESPKLNGSDKVLFENVCDEIKTQPQPFYIQAITVASHSPFNRVKMGKLKFTNQLHDNFKKYLTCLNYTDECMSEFFKEFDKSDVLKNSTIVITGDHTVFKKNMLKEANSSIENFNLDINEYRNYIPLIIYSPKIKEDIVINDIYYQMDIFPTILNLIGCNNYYWKGLGENILNHHESGNRDITEDHAYQLSEKIIKSNFFKLLKDSLEKK